MILNSYSSQVLCRTRSLSDSGGDIESLHDESNDEGHDAGVVERVFRQIRGVTARS